MNKRNVLTAAGMASLVLAAGATAVGANLGLLGNQSEDTVGNLSPGTTLTTTSAPTETVYVDEYVDAPAAPTTTPVEGVQPSTAAELGPRTDQATSLTGAAGDDGSDDDSDEGLQASDDGEDD